LERLVSAYGPRADDVRLADDAVQGRIVYAVGIQRPPAAWHAEKDSEPAVSLVVLQKFHQPLALSQSVLPPVIEADAPHGDYGLAAVPQVGGVLLVCADLHSVHKQLPVLDDVPRSSFGQPGQVVHDRITATVAIRALSTMSEDDVAVA